jgi:predicted nucleotide-binding protein
MDLEQARMRLHEGAQGLAVAEERRLPDDHGTQLILRNGAIVNVYDTGSVTVQGKNRELVELLIRYEG